MPHPTSSPCAEPLSMRLLGGFRVAVGSRVIADGAWRLRKARAVLKVLALAPEHRLHREHVMEALWPDAEPAAAANNLHATLHVLRRVLEPDLAAATPSTYLQLHDDLLVLAHSSPLWIDTAAFEQACAVARRTQEPARYQAAIDLYTGDLLPEDRYEDWAAGRREELRTLFLALLIELARLYEARGEHAAAIAALERVVAREPTHEEAHVGLMRLSALLGRRYQALRQYQLLRDALQRELEAPPAAASQALYADILAGRFPLGHASTTRPFPEASRLSALNGPQRSEERPAWLVDSPGTTGVESPPGSGPSGAGGPGALPAPSSSFIGREREVTTVTRLLADHWLLTLTGAGGCGKTRLALRVAAGLRDAYADGACLVELATLRDPHLVPRAVAAMLHVAEEPGQPVLETLVQALRSRRLLLVLDNCEHLKNACARLVQALLPSCPHLRVLATSRASLGLAAEATWRVPSLAAPDPDHLSAFEDLVGFDAVRLFGERAAASRPGWALTPQNALAVVQVCHRLDGIPLALELAAGRVKVLAVEQIAARLDDAPRLLRGGSPSAAPRHQTLRATLDWSYDLLSEPEQTLFQRFSVFAGGWTLDAAEAVCAGDGIDEADVLDLLAQLVDASLVTVEEQHGQVRYRLLETVRQYGTEKLHLSGGEASTRSRHAAWYLALAECAEPELTGAGQAAWLARLDAEHDNLRAALRWLYESGNTEDGLRLAVALWWFWYMRAHLTEARRWLDAFLAHGQGGGRAVAMALRARALTRAGGLAQMHGDYGTATALLEASLTPLREVGDTWNLAASLNNLGSVARDQGDYERAATLYAESVALLRTLDDPFAIASALNNLGATAHDQGDFERAQIFHEESLALRKEQGDQWGVAMSLLNLGDVACRRGDHGRALALYQESLTLRRDIGDKLGIAYCLEGLARVAQAEERWAHAAHLFAVAAVLRDAIGTPLPPADHTGIERAVVGVRAALGDAAFAAAWAEGQAMPLEQVIAEVLAGSDDGPAAVPATAIVEALPTALTPPAGSPPTVTLTRREREIAALLAAPLTNGQIAARLGLAERTVDTHVGNILRKLGFTSRTQIATWAQEERLAPLAHDRRHARRHGAPGKAKITYT